MGGAETFESAVGGYIVRARRTDAWDAIITLLVALEAEHPHDFHAVMQGCRRLSYSRPEVDGLDDLLLAPEQHLHDVAIDRERRRSQQGYATPADARAFLQLARRPKQMQSGAAATGSLEVNPIVAAYFRAADDIPESSQESEEQPDGTLESPRVDATDTYESIAAVVELLAEAGMIPTRPHALLEAAHGDARDAGLTRVQRLMAYVRDTDETVYLTRSRELAFVANTLLAGCSVQSRPFRPQEASDAAASICNLGLEYWPARWPAVASPGASSPPDSFLIDHDLVTAFEVGWSVLHQDVSVFVAQQLISTLEDLRCVDRDIRRGLIALRRKLAEQRDAGTPWLARDTADVLASIDATAWVSVLGLLDECPVLPAALTAIVEGRTTTVSPTDFDFIATAAQIDSVRLFMRKLPGLLEC